MCGHDAERISPEAHCRVSDRERDIAGVLRDIFFDTATWCWFWAGKTVRTVGFSVVSGGRPVL